MSSDWLDSRGLRFDPAHVRFGRGPAFATAQGNAGAELDATLTAKAPERARLHDAIGRTREYLF